jgi:RNA polymerase sigma factor (TIGR02999 family)
MSQVSVLLTAVEQGDPHAASQLLPLVYEELRRLAGARLAHEKPGQTLEPTALVHEAYLRLVGKDADAHWDNRGHFFAAAAEAMRRILVESARRKHSLKRGGDCSRQELDDALLIAPLPQEDLVALDEALKKLHANVPAERFQSAANVAAWRIRVASIRTMCSTPWRASTMPRTHGEDSPRRVPPSWQTPRHRLLGRYGSVLGSLGPRPGADRRPRTIRSEGARCGLRPERPLPGDG